MPVPQPGQTKDDFIEMCIPIVIEDGTAEDEEQAYAVCLSMWEQGRDAMSEIIERRTIKAPELRVMTDDDGVTRIVGYAAVFDQLSEDLGGFVEEIDPAAFNKTVQEADVRALWQHDAAKVLGRTKNDTLHLIIDEIGLRYEAFPPDTTWARDALETTRRGDVDQSSFGFDAMREQWREPATPSDLPIRRLLEVKLFDVSPVTFPAYPQTSAEARSHAAALQESEEEPQDIDDAPGVDSHAAEEDDAAAEQALERLSMRRKRLELLDRYFYFYPQA